MNTLKSIAWVASLFAATPALAFDGSRQGFILGLGIGLHNINSDFIVNGAKVGSQSEGGVATSFKIGGGVTDQLALYYVRNASWYSAPYFDGFMSRDITYTIGLSGFGASYFLAPTAPSGYFLAAVGTGDISAPFESNIRADTGGAFMLGGGYEFNRNLMFEATLQATNIQGSGSPPLTLKSSSLQFTINYLFY